MHTTLIVIVPVRTYHPWSILRQSSQTPHSLLLSTIILFLPITSPITNASPCLSDMTNPSPVVCCTQLYNPANRFVSPPAQTDVERNRSAIACDKVPSPLDKCTGRRWWMEKWKLLTRIGTLVNINIIIVRTLFSFEAGQLPGFDWRVDIWHHYLHFYHHDSKLLRTYSTSPRLCFCGHELLRVGEHFYKSACSFPKMHPFDKHIY